jgi:hypothetical protein
MKKLVVVGGALLALLVAPVLSATRADARTKDKPNMGYCKSGAKVGDMKNCKENGGKK